MSSQQTNEASKFTAIKDQAVGTVKEAFGNVFGNNKLELEGKAQKVHGQIEYQYAKALKEGETEPQKFQQAYHPQDPSQVQEFDQHSAPMAGQVPPPPTPADFVQPPAAPLNNFAQPSTGSVPVPPPNPQQQSTEPSQMSAWKDQAVGAMKENWGEVTNNPQMEMEGKAQNLHGKMEGRTEPPVQQGSKSSVEGDKVSSMSAMKDKAMGSLKENWGSATGNTTTELEGKAQQMHGRNEAEFAKAQKQGMAEPAHYEKGTKETHHAEGKVEGDKVSSMSAMKDKAMGSLKENWGSATGNTTTELEGKAQQMHGRNEAEFAKAQKQGLTEPAHYEKGTKETHHAEGKVEGENVSTLGSLKDRAMGSMKETLGSMTGNQNMELKGKAQNIHGRNEAAFAQAQKEGLSEPEHFAYGKKLEAEGEVVSDKPSKMSGWKDQTVGAMKETLGSVTNNQNMELKGKAQNVHGRNEAEFAKAQSQGLAEPEHFGQGMKTERAEGSVEGDKVSSMSAMKDKAIGTLKENWGSATGNTTTELQGKAQQMHGRNEAEFAKAQKQGLTEPEHYAHGTKTTDHAQGEIVSQEPSKMSGYKDQAVGTVKESLGKMTNNQNMELEGKAQKMQGSHATAQADSKNTINA